MAFLRVSEQVQAMRKAWPAMKLVYQAGWGAGWTGCITPYDRTYRVRIDFFLGFTLGDCDLRNWGAEVRVTEPDLIAECAPGLPPHLYGADSSAHLCLFDPASDDWDFGMPLATTIMPWAAQWLAFYEVWQATGRWTGPERHPELHSPTQPRDGGKSDAASDAARPSPRQSRCVADWLGTEGSRPLLRAVALDRRPSRRDWWHGLDAPERRIRQVLNEPPCQQPGAIA